MDIVEPRIEEYMRSLYGGDHPVAAAMERDAEESGFPIVGRLVGVTLELLARSVGATRVLELGSGFGYSAYWFARAVGPGGEVHMTEGDQANQDRAVAALGEAGLGDRVHAHVGDALGIIDELPGTFDVIFSDIDKGDYPAAWEKAKERIRPGGLYICDNVLWSGRVTQDVPEDDVQPGWTEAIVLHNASIAGDPRFVSSIIPTRDGVMVALRLPG